jgi:porin
MNNKKNIGIGIAAASCMIGLWAHPLSAADPTSPNAGSASLSERTYLMSDWGGARSWLAERGIILDVQATQFYQGVVDGSSDDNWKYGVKGDYFLTVIGEKAGLWKGLLINLHAETRAGDDVNALSGLSPANSNMLMPNSDDTTALTQVMVTQMVGPQLGLFAAKINTFDFFDSVYHTGRGIDGFMNISLMSPLGLARPLNVTIPAAGAFKIKGKEIQGAAVVYDPNNCSATSCLDPLFGDGAGVAALWKFYTGISQDSARAGYISVGGAWSGKEYAVVEPSSLYINPGEGLSLRERQEAWSIFSVVDQPLWADPLNQNRSLNFKGMYTISDGEANPIKWSATAALELNGSIAGRDKDVIGVGYFHNELSSGFKNTVGPLLSVAATLVDGTPTRITIEDTDGFEAYYKAHVTPWLSVTGDLQLITETLSADDTKVVTGVRGKVTF